MASFRGKIDFVTLVRKMLEKEGQAKEELEAVAAQRIEQAFVPQRTSNRGKTEIIQTAPFPFANDREKNPLSVKKIVRAWQEDEQALDNLLSEFQTKGQEIDRAEARDKEDADVFDEVNVKILRLSRVKASVPLLKRGINHPQEQEAELVRAPSCFDELQDMIRSLALHELFTSGIVQPPRLPNDDELAEELNIPLGLLHLTMTDSQRLDIQQKIAALRQKADEDLAHHKTKKAELEEDCRLAAQKWAQMSEALQRQVEKHKSNKRTTWFETTIQDLYAAQLPSPSSPEHKIAEEDEND